MGEREVLFAFANLVSQLTRDEPPLPDPLEKWQAATFSSGLTNVAQAYAHAVTNQMGCLLKSVPGEP